MKVLVWYEVIRSKVEIDIPDDEYALLDESPEINQDYLRKQLYQREQLPILPNDEFLDDVTINKIVVKDGKNSKSLYEDWYH